MSIDFGKKKLGFGLMRLPILKEDDPSTIDIEQAKEMVDLFMERGFAYFDTALMYHNGASEKAVKELLTSRKDRDSYTLATKMHDMYFKEGVTLDDIFNRQLEKTGAGYFDFYLLHNLGEDNLKTFEERDAFAWLADKKAKGLVKHMGFSSHDNAAFLKKILTTHPEMEFVQIQLNYLDWENEGIQSRKCYEVCEAHNKPVIVMEPVKGGTLANVPEVVESLYKSHAPEASVSSWAIRFAASLPGVKVVLSGMSNREQMEDNSSYMQELKPITEEERAIISTAVKTINASVAIPCTSCNYCTENCPQNIPIPRYFSLYNADLQEVEGKEWNPQGTYLDRLTVTMGAPESCIACGQCEGVCPQHLPIVDNLKTIAKHFGRV